jgi:putative zinc finger/helix-turn-helix YgiT family protein
MSMKHHCGECGHEMEETRGDYPFPESGLSNVLLKNIPLLRCPNCGNVEPIIPRAKALMRTLALAVIHKRGALCGEEVRFIRKHIRWKSIDLAKFLGVDKTTVSKWENNENPVGPSNDRLIRLLVFLQIMREDFESSKLTKRRLFGDELRPENLARMLDIKRAGVRTCARIDVADEDGEYHCAMLQQ